MLEIEKFGLVEMSSAEVNEIEGGFIPLVICGIALAASDVAGLFFCGVAIGCAVAAGQKK